MLCCKGVQKQSVILKTEVENKNMLTNRFSEVYEKNANEKQRKLSKNLAKTQITKKLLAIRLLVISGLFTSNVGPPGK